MNLVIDFGNSTQKMALFDDGQQCDFLLQKVITIEDIVNFVGQHKINKVILSTVISVEKQLLKYLQTHFDFIVFDSQTPIPLNNKYQSKATLGSDRLACAVAAHCLCPQNNVLVLQMGTCITMDFVSQEGEYIGGSIAPGMQMRFQALHNFSAQLPKVDYRSLTTFVGTTTEESILSGVINGISAECNGMINQYKEKYANLKIIFTGGDAKLFENSIKNEIFAYSNLVLIGLNQILMYNAEK